MLTARADTVWAALNGIICIYKPLELSLDLVRKTIKQNLCSVLNNLETRPPSTYLEIKQSSIGFSYNVRPSYSDDILSVGPRYQMWDIAVNFGSRMGDLTSGVTVLGLNGGTRIIKGIRQCNFTKCYHLKGIFGQATRNFHIDNKVVARAKYDHVDRHFFEKVIASYQAANQRRMFTECGINLTTQEAYDLAVSGLYRPNKEGNPIVYSLQLVDFSIPNFTIEVQCINETEEYLLNLIHNLGISVKTLATCTGIRCIRYGCFNVKHSLLQKHWTCQEIVSNMELCFNLLQKNFPNSLRHIPTVNSCDSKKN